MQSVIGEYYTLPEAEQAVRELEARLSIQDLKIADRHHNFWRKLAPTEGGEFPDWVNYVVLMSGEPDEIDQARALLQKATSH